MVVLWVAAGRKEGKEYFEVQIVCKWRHIQGSCWLEGGREGGRRIEELLKLMSFCVE